MTDNKLFRDVSNYLWIVLAGEQKSEEIKKIINGIQAFTQVTNKKYNLIFDITSVNLVSSSGREAIFNFLISKNFEKVAAIGLENPYNIFTNLFQKIEPLKNVKNFKTKEEGLKWLRLVPDNNL